MKFLLSVSVLCFVAGYGDALANPIQDFLSRVKGPGGSNSRPSPLQETNAANAARLLKDLNLKSSTKPVLAGARVQQIPNLLSAAVPAVLRAASGVFADGYKIALIPRDDTKYTYAATADQQLEETGICKAPNEPLILYEFESCPFCRKVREACSSKYPFCIASLVFVVCIDVQLILRVRRSSFYVQFYHYLLHFVRPQRTGASIELKSRQSLGIRPRFPT